MTYQTLKQSLAAFQLKWLSERAAPEREGYFVASIEILNRVFYRITWKRVLDICISVLALLLLSPILLLTAVLIKITSHGPVFFNQERIGINRRMRKRRIANSISPFERRNNHDRRVVVNYGMPFFMYKFRTMIDSAENGKPQWAIKGDPRITPFGKILRKTRIDEIPQFVNVIKGDMSLVGPRPERAFFIGKVEKDIPEFHLRLRAKPGITGLAQVNLGYTNDTTGLMKKLHFDMEYIRALSIRTDLKILLKTIGVVITGKGAY